MLDEFKKFLEEKKLFAADQGILLAVSGGVDSMAMMNLFEEAGISYQVAHCNFQLRGKDSDADESLVREVTKKYKRKLHVKSFQTNQYAELKGVSVQMAARELRYQWFDELLRENNLQIIATAHHQDDRFETLIHNLIRGTGLAGLVPLPEKDRRFIRPLMFTDRKEIEKFATSKKIKWREDLSNQSDKYARNRIRLNVIPELIKLNPSLLETFEDTFARLKQSQQIQDDFIKAFRKVSLSENGNELKLNIRNLVNSPGPSVILYDILNPLGFSFRQCEEILNSMENNTHSGKKFLSGTHTVFIDRDFLIIEPTGDTDSFEVKVDENLNPVILSNGTLKFEIVEGANIIKDHEVAAVDLSKIRFPLIVRNIKEGDWFYPLGMKGRKKISDFLIDEKVPLSLKTKIPLVFCEHELVWVSGLRLDDRFKVSESTTKTLIIRYEQD